MASDGVLHFNPELLQRHSDKLLAQPDRPVVEQVRSLGATIAPAAFGTVPGGAEAAQRIAAWVQATSAEFDRVSADVADLGTRTGSAAQMARDIDPELAAMASSATPAAPGGTA